MSNLLLSVYKELQKNNPYSHEYMDVILQKVNVKRKSSELTAVIHSSRLLSYAAIEYFALFMHQKYPQFSIEVTNTFEKDNLTKMLDEILINNDFIKSLSKSSVSDYIKVDDFKFIRLFQSNSKLGVDFLTSDSNDSKSCSV